MAKQVNPISSYFAQRVSSFRIARGWTQEKLAHEMGISRNYVSMIEGGRVPAPSMIKLFESLENAPFYAAGGRPAGTSFPPARETSPGGGLAREERAAATPEQRRPREQPGHGLHARIVPLLTWAQAAELADVADLYPEAGHVAFEAHDARAFAVTLTGDAMEPPFAPGDVAIIYPSRPAANGNLVLGRTLEGEVFFKRLTVLRAGEFRFSSYNAAYPAFDRAAGELAWIYPVASVHKPTL